MGLLHAIFCEATCEQFHFFPRWEACPPKIDYPCYYTIVTMAHLRTHNRTTPTPPRPVADRWGNYFLTGLQRVGELGDGRGVRLRARKFLTTSGLPVWISDRFHALAWISSFHGLPPKNKKILATPSVITLVWASATFHQPQKRVSSGTRIDDICRALW